MLPAIEPTGRCPLYVPKFLPTRVTVEPAVVGPFWWVRSVRTGASYVKAMAMVPIIPLTSAVTSSKTPTPPSGRHANEVPDIHFDLTQLVPPTDKFGEMSVIPKFVPSMVIVAMPF